MTQDDGNTYRGQSAFRWKVSARTLQRWRSKRHGPVWTSIGGSIRYPMASVLAFETGGRSDGGRS